MYKDLISINRVSNLHPLMRSKVFHLLEIAKKEGIDLRVTKDGHFRSFDEQNALYAKTPKVTNARGGESFHNYGLAVDLVVMDNGQPVWDYKDSRWSKIGKIGAKVGLNWGGNWNKPDRPHFEYPVSLSLLQAKYRNGDIDKNNFVNLT